MTTTATDAEESTCHRCPPGGGTVVASYSGGGPAWRAGLRAEQEAKLTGLPHHDHYDPAADAFLVVRDDS
jgi:hypothetical protein